MKSLFSLLFWTLLGASTVLWATLQMVPTTDVASKPLLLPPENLKFFALGYDELLADTLWLRTIQDFDFCENRTSPKLKPTEYQCKQGWVFHMIEAITELAPNFREPYYSGAMMLTVVVNDIDGASKIFDKGVAKFPEDGHLIFTAAYQALIEEKNNAKASALLVRAGHLGLPPWVFSLAARLQEREGQLQLSKSILEDAYNSRPEGYGAERIKQRLDEVNAEIAKETAAKSAH
jgi:hypothetical protein